MSELSATLSIAMKVNLGNYESADAFLSLSGITPETTQEEMEDLLDGPARIAYDALKVRLGARVADLRSKR
jgi:hypothetical protein